MRHVTISSYGQFLGVTGNRLVVTDANGGHWETALSRVRSIRIEKTGVTVSTNLILQCAMRGIRIFVLDWRHVAVAAVSGCNQHAVVALRQAQFECIRTSSCFCLAKEMLYAKLRNQRAVLLYFNKYQSKVSHIQSQELISSAQRISEFATRIKYCQQTDRWRDVLMGLEGKCADVYWQSLAQSKLLPSTFMHRQGRGAQEITNAALNYGYSILQSYIHAALDNAGFELYAGFLHVPRPGRASLVCDLMEEYRAWVVDRNVIKLRSQLQKNDSLTPALKRSLCDAIDATMASTIVYHDKRVKLENVLQRQAYRLAGAVMGERVYQSLKFKW